MENRREMYTHIFQLVLERKSRGHTTFLAPFFGEMGKYLSHFQFSCAFNYEHGSNITVYTLISTSLT